MRPVRRKLAALACGLVLAAACAGAWAQDDPYLWLEDVSGEKALEWVKQQNAATQPAIEASPGFRELHQRLLGIYNSRERIPQVRKRGQWLYNFWQDERAPRGVWRRNTLEE